MRIIGLTGSIGMGKSTAAKMLKRKHIPVHDADATVHKLLGPGGAALVPVAEAFPDVEGLVTPQNSINRPALGRRVFGDKVALKQLESILHPLVWQDSETFLRQCMRRREKLAVLDIPLLYEGNSWRKVDGVFLVSAPDFVQRARVLNRPGMTEETLASILKRQVPDAHKRRLADIILETGRTRARLYFALCRALRISKKWPARHWPPSGWQPPPGRRDLLNGY